MRRDRSHDGRHGCGACIFLKTIYMSDFEKISLKITFNFLLLIFVNLIQGYFGSDLVSVNSKLDWNDILAAIFEAK